jgi:guanylate kinase
MPKGKFVLIIGPSGVGKDTIMAKLRERPGMVQMISRTSRPPRPNEVDGRDYHFSSREDFARRIADGEFIEQAEYAGNFYGTSRADLDRLLETGKTVLKIVEVQGARIIKSKMPECFAVFIMPESLDQLRKRLEARPGAKPEDIDKRLSRAPEELAAADEFDAVVINREGRLERTVAEVAALIA